MSNHGFSCFHLHCRDPPFHFFKKKEEKHYGIQQSKRRTQMEEMERR